MAMTAVAATAAMASCSGKPEFIGEWTSASPENITASIPAASRATSQLTLDFAESNADKKEGQVTLSSVIDLTQPVQPDSNIVEPYEVSVAATATVNGSWFRADDDELVLSFDMSSMNVAVDPHGVSFSANVLTGSQQPMLDSLTAVTMERWKGEITRAFGEHMAQFGMIEDVEVSDGRNVLTFEVKVPGEHDRKYALRRVLRDN